MNEQPTVAQMTYRASLIAQRLQESRPGKGVVGGPAPNILRYALLVANLPEPTDKRQASLQIDALKDGTRGIWDYAPTQEAHYTTVMARALANLKARYQGKPPADALTNDDAWLAFVGSLGE